MDDKPHNQTTDLQCYASRLREIAEGLDGKPGVDRQVLDDLRAAAAALEKDAARANAT